MFLIFFCGYCLFGKKEHTTKRGARIAQRKWRYKRLNGIKAVFLGRELGNKSWRMSHIKPVFMAVQQLSLGANSIIHIHDAPAFVS